jgi:hypothetical protein
MLDRLRNSGWKSLVAALYAMAMAVLGFAHLPVAAANVTPGAQIVLAALPDGTMPFICGQTDPAKPVKNVAGRCDACQLTSAPGALPAPLVLVAPPVAMKLPPVRVIRSAAKAEALEPQSRGPPQLS